MLRKVLRQWHAQISNMATTIQNNKMIVSFLDTLEEFRDLALEEWNFRNIVLDHLENLLEQQTKYWKQRGKIKLVVLGDENTKKFILLLLFSIIKMQYLC
jgi:L-lactate utilization protein LutB